MRLAAAAAERHIERSPGDYGLEASEGDKSAGAKMNAMNSELQPVGAEWNGCGARADAESVGGQDPTDV